MQYFRTTGKLIAAVLLLTACAKGKTGEAQPATVAGTYKLVWSDEFNQSSLDTTQWFYRQPGVRHNGFNDSSAVYTLPGGNLVIEVYSDTSASGVKHYTGMIATRRQFLYGRFECRVAFRNKPGSWSAFWLQTPTMGNPMGNSRVAGMEIDVVESLPDDGRAYLNLHWDGYEANHKTAGIKTADVGCNDGNFHTYTLEWTPEAYVFWIDGKEVWRFTQAVSQRSEFIILSSEVKQGTTGIWAGSIVPGGYGRKGNSQTRMVVDYVKVWQKQ